MAAENKARIEIEAVVDGKESLGELAAAIEQAGGSAEIFQRDAAQLDQALEKLQQQQALVAELEKLEQRLRRTGEQLDAARQKQKSLSDQVTASLEATKRQIAEQSNAEKALAKLDGQLDIARQRQKALSDEVVAAENPSARLVALQDKAALKSEGLARAVEVARSRVQAATQAARDGGQPTAALAAAHEKATEAIERLNAAAGHERTLLTELGGRLKTAGLDAGNLAGNQAILAGKTAEAVTRLGQITDVLRSEKAGIDALAGAFKQLNVQPFKDVQREVEATRAALKRLEQANRDGTISDKELAKAQVEAARQIHELGNATNGVAKTLSDARVALGTAALAFTGVGAAAGRTLSDFRAFEAELAKISTLVEQAPGELGLLAEQVQQLGSEFGKAPTAEAQALYEIISAGASDAAEATKLLTAANKLAIGGVTDVKTAADGLTSVLAAYGLSAAHATEVSDALFVAAADGKTTIEELSQSIGNLAPIASQTGVGLDEMLASISALTRGGIKTAEAITDVRGIINAVLTPSKEAGDLAKELGLQFDAQALKAKGLAGFLADVRDKTGGSAEKAALLFGRVDALNGVLTLTGNQAGAFADSLEHMTQKAGETESAFGKVAASSNFKFDQLAAEFSIFKENIGGVISGFLTPFARALKDLLEVFNSLPAGISTAVAALVTLGPAIAASLGGFRALGQALTLLRAQATGLGLTQLVATLTGAGAAGTTASVGLGAAGKAEATCALIRQKTKIPIFAARPRPLLARDWMIDSYAFQTLAWMEQHFLPEFRRDLGRLPAPREGEEGHAIELGRLLMIAAWRIGLARTPVVEPFLRWVAGDQPILATGELRYACIGIPPLRGNVDRMRRTVFFDDFTATYLLVERARLRSALDAYFGEPRRARRGVLLQKAMVAYLASLGVPGGGMRLSAVMDAAVQHFMLKGSPILAAYARGEFVTMDLDDVELRRLAGLVPYRESKSAVGRALPINRFDEPIDEDLVGAEALPRDLRAADRNFVHALTAKRTPYFDQLLHEVRAISPTTRVERLLHTFAIWLLVAPPEQDVESTSAGAKPISSDVEGRNRRKSAPDKKPVPRAKEWNARVKKQWAAHVTILGHALIGLAGFDDDCAELDEAMLERLEESCGEYFRESALRGAWRQFRRFLRASEDLAGFSVVNLPNDNERDVSARILRADQIESIRARVASARSGIGNPDFRLSATRLFSFASDFGARRGELEHLRTIDVQGNLLRIQPYNDHTLKTAWSARVVPLAFLSEDSRESIASAKGKEVVKLIDPRPGINADGDNFFYAMNQVIKDITQDDNLGLHHLRHTAASRLLLSVLRPAVSLDGLFGDIPWLEPLLVDEQRLNILLGSEGPSGHGLQATTALLGHGHSTTTLHHYIHTVGIAFYALARTLDPTDVSTSFENRLSSLTTAQRWATKVRSENIGAEKFVVSRAMRKFIEAQSAYAAGIDSDERAAATPTDAGAAAATVEAEDAITFDRIESIDLELRGEGKATGDAWVLRASRGLETLAGVASGKRGSSIKRHPLLQNEKGQWMPDRLDAQSATKIAVDLTVWLQDLRVRHPRDFEWLLRKWVLDSERERGRMRLLDGGGDKKDEKPLAHRLPVTPAVRIEVEEARVARGRKGTSAKRVPRMRIRCAGNGVHDRDIGAIRWVMTWIVAVFWVPTTSSEVSDSAQQ